MHPGQGGQDAPHSRRPPAVPADLPQGGGRGEEKEALRHDPAEKEGIGKQGEKGHRPAGGPLPQLPRGQLVEIDAAARIAQEGHQQPRRHSIAGQQGNQPHQPGI